MTLPALDAVQLLNAIQGIGNAADAEAAELFRKGIRRPRCDASMHTDVRKTWGCAQMGMAQREAEQLRAELSREQHAHVDTKDDSSARLAKCAAHPPAKPAEPVTWMAQSS